MVVPNLVLWPPAEREGEESVRLLAVVVRPHRVHPQDHLLVVLVLLGGGRDGRAQSGFGQ